jgi:hypothetical protein
MIVVIVAGILGMWLAGNGHPAGWGLVAGAHLLWLPYALAAGQAGFALAVAAFGLVCLGNYRRSRSTLPDRLMGRRDRRI